MSGTLSNHDTTRLSLGKQKGAWRWVCYTDTGEHVSGLRCVRFDGQHLTFTCFSDPRMADPAQLVPSYQEDTEFGLLSLRRRRDGAEVTHLREVSIISTFDGAQLMLVECVPAFLDSPPVDASYMDLHGDRAYGDEQPDDFQKFGREPIGTTDIAA